jgi:3-deoxy-manno-octulosonate cytidylyltransferase (CMP-KDO synthetase)
MEIVGIIPARYGSTRLPGKPLLDLGGKPIIQHVYERAAEALERVIVATDDKRIVAAVHAFGGQAVLTRADHRCGTDRIAEIAVALSADIIVNVQGDEPFLDPVMIQEAVAPLRTDLGIQASTLSRAVLSEERLADPNLVKVVTNEQGDALYFSRSIIPYPRHKEYCRWREHVGIYVYRRAFLLDFVRWAATPLELAESLEQLRILERGFRIRVVETHHGYGAPSIDTMEDLELARRYLTQSSG